MPYITRKRGNKFCVINKDTGKVLSCKFKTKEQAEKYRKLRAMIHKWKKGEGPKPKVVK